jgi:hypothetical protein
VDLEVISLQHVLTAHFLHTPAMQVQDVYKLLHQGALGSEHAVQDEQQACYRLEQELAEMGAGPEDPLIDPLPPDGRIVRVHLRSFRQSAGDLVGLLRAFIRTADEYHGSVDTLKEFCAQAVEMTHTGSLPVNSGEIEAFFDRMEEQGFPAVHHSAVYQRLYRPAYRVVARQYLEGV